MTDQVHDSTVAGTAKENIPTMSKPMDDIHGNVEDISNKASGYKVRKGPPPQSISHLSYAHSVIPLDATRNKIRVSELTDNCIQATISNPNTKESTKEAAKEKLEQLGGEDAFMKNNGKGE